MSTNSFVINIEPTELDYMPGETDQMGAVISGKVSLGDPEATEIRLEAPVTMTIYDSSGNPDSFTVNPVAADIVNGVVVIKYVAGGD